MIPLRWSWRDLALYRVVARWPNGDFKESHDLFALRCYSCNRLTLGCDEHWFCGLCRPCKAILEADDDRP